MEANPYPRKCRERPIRFDSILTSYKLSMLDTGALSAYETVEDAVTEGTIYRRRAYKEALD